MGPGFRPSSSYSAPLQRAQSGRLFGTKGAEALAHTANLQRPLMQSVGSVTWQFGYRLT